MGVIKALDQSVVNKIAAGEIIIAPANALKEMLENSIDAGSTNIQVVAKDGGIKVLQISDNGSGVMKDDLPILCQRFTTSKLSTFEDLGSLNTYGFRGEALASISHIAHLSILTKTKDSPCAWACHYSQGKLVPAKAGESPGPKPIAGKNGTQITVENLFYNFSSRLKSLKSSNEEFIKILEVVQKYAIHTANVGFSVKKLGESHNSLTIRESQNIKERIRAVYSSSVANNIIPIESQDMAEIGLKEVNGQISNLNYNANKKKAQVVFFINNRLVDCDPLKKSLLNIYSAYLPKGAKPFVYLSLSINPAQLDVNIHPTKKEVRFLHEEEIIDFVCQIVQSALSNVDDSRTFRAVRLLTRSENRDYIENQELSRPAAPPPPKKRQKISLNQSLSQSFAFGASAPKPHESKLVRVDGTQAKITSFLQPTKSKSTQEQNSLPSQDTSIFENSVFELDDSSTQDGSFMLASKENFTFVANERVKVTLDSVGLLRSTVEKSVNRELTKVFSDFVFVGIVQYSSRMLTFQSGISLFLVDYGKLFYHLFYQIGVSDFANFGKIFLKTGVSIRECVLFVDKKTRPDNVDEAKSNELINERIGSLVGMKDMLEEYFSIVLDVSDPMNPNLSSVPLLVKNHLPSMAKLAIFIYKVVMKIDFDDETACLDGVLKEIALFYVPDSVPGYDDVKNGEESEDMIKYIKTVEFLLNVVKKRFLATDDLVDSLVEIANLPSLYKCFERC
ncbi:mismatch repair ATPase [Saccharomycopsis crataegensis]|uniref:Mismatch repair ATPase n=1 Tax=Saccharomycopsis crataegensis TaxID=43959 RepID=A0AAV5QQ64_9ASCO|nr:mismatch repair ATPase [Saccharomycopsis crataegensis]